jgi:hypothetical protein
MILTDALLDQTARMSTSNPRWFPIARQRGHISLMGVTKVLAIKRDNQVVQLVEAALGSARAMSWLSMKGSCRSQSAGGSGPQSWLLRSRTPVYIMVGTPSTSTVQQPEKQPSASNSPGDGRKAGGRCSQWMRSFDTACPQTKPQSHSQLVGRC